MIDYSTYIEDLADPSFCCDGGGWNGNIPARRGVLALGLYRAYFAEAKQVALFVPVKGNGFLEPVE